VFSFYDVYLHLTSPRNPHATRRLVVGVDTSHRDEYFLTYNVVQVMYAPERPVNPKVGKNQLVRDYAQWEVEFSDVTYSAAWVNNRRLARLAVTKMYRYL